ncbi:hypothetical protein ABT061_03245 [Streptosporangium sp. NPDC002544]|uniref:hypothetical protein n=1 Tax=Streptosporangium sp. NPDC002544 TaxID=3154538 RepID=UPI003332135F
MRLPVLLLLGALTACGAPATTARTPDIPATASAPPAREAPGVPKASAIPPPSPASTDPTPGSACTPAPAGKLNLRLLRQTAFDYDPLNSPEELAAKTPLVVAGTVEDFLPGQIVEEGIPGDRTHYVLMPVRVTERFKGPAARLVHVKFYQGARRNESPALSVADFRRAVPRGTRVLLFVYPDTREGTVIKDRAALPAGTPIYSAHPQGVLLGRGLTVIGGMEEIDPASRWADPCGLDGIATRLRAAGHQGQ